MRSIIYVLIGVFFGVVLYKSEAASWFRIYEMFQFKSFHMYGIIGSSVVLGVIFLRLIKYKRVRSIYGQEIHIPSKDKSFSRYIFGGIIFGLGWALAGACTGPLFVLIGAGYTTIFIVVLSAILGTFVYGLVRHKLPH